MFNVSYLPEFTRTVEVQSPEGDGVRTDTFTATFRWLPSDALDDFATDTTEGIKSMIRAILVNCDDLIDAEDQPLPWSDDLREDLLAWSNVRTALLLTFNKAWLEEKRGN